MLTVQVQAQVLEVIRRLWVCSVIGCRRRLSRRYAICSQCRFALNREMVL